MSIKNTLTNEKLNARFESPFALVAHAINLATEKVHRGEGLDSNPANEVLELIAYNRDLLIEEPEDDETLEEQAV